MQILWLPWDQRPETGATAGCCLAKSGLRSGRLCRLLLWVDNVTSVVVKNNSLLATESATATDPDMQRAARFSLLASLCLLLEALCRTRGLQPRQFYCLNRKFILFHAICHRFASRRKMALYGFWSSVCSFSLWALHHLLCCTICGCLAKHGMRLYRRMKWESPRLMTMLKCDHVLECLLNDKTIKTISSADH